MTAEERIREKLVKEGIKSQHFDPSGIEDSVAQSCEWNPAKPGGKNAGTHCLKILNSGRMEFRVKNGALWFLGFIAVMGLAIVVGMGLSGFIQQDYMKMGLSVLVGGSFIGLAVALLWDWSTPRVFDFTLGCFWKGRSVPNPYTNFWPRDSCSISDIYAIQLFREYCESKSSKGGRTHYYSFEINLVFQNGKRLNVVDHADKEQILQDGISLSQRLNIPLWKNF